MANLLQSSSGWIINNAFFSNGLWTLKAAGVFSAANGSAVCQYGQSGAADSLTATCNYELSSFNNDPQGPRDIWFIVSADGSPVFSQQLAQGGVTNQPVNGSFSLNLTLPNEASVEILVAGNSAGAPIFGYNDYGIVTLNTGSLVQAVDDLRVVQFRYSKDGGHNWSGWVTRSLGEVGEFQKRVRAYRFGQGRQWVFDIKVTSPVKADLIAMSIQASGGPA